MADFVASLSPSFSSIPSSIVSFVDVVKENLNVEFYRLNTFEKWPSDSPVYPIRLANTGFYFLGKEDYVRCYFCGKEKHGWRKGDTPYKTHQQLNPNCPFLVSPSSTDNIPIESEKVPLSDKFSKIETLLSFTTGAISVQDSQSPGVNSHPSSLSEHSRSEQGSLTLPSLDNSGQTTQPQRSLSIERGYCSLPTEKGANSGDTQVLPSTGHVNKTAPLKQQTNSQLNMDRRNLNQSPKRSSSSQDNERRTSRDNVAGQRPQPVLNPADQDAGLLRYERNRLETFSSWPSGAPILPRDLAKSGFYYTGSDDRVQCVFCRGILKDWEHGDVPHIEHKDKFPRCPFILGMDVGNVKQTANQPAQNFIRSSDIVNQPQSRMEALGINTERPRHPNYAVEATRLNTFQSWPTYRYQTPEQLASAGFFYAGFGDNVRCFFCDGGLRNWEAGDDPWIEHTRWFPKCPHVRNVKGEAYIVAIQERFNNPAQAASPPASGSHTVEPREIRARMELPVVRTVLETGVNRKTVMIAIERRLRETGDDYPNAESLMNAVLTLEENPEQLGTRTTDIPGSVETPGPSSRDEPIPGPSHAGRDPQGSQKILSETNSSEQNELEEENRMLKEQKICKICLDEEVGMVFLPCGHLCSCVNCAPAVRKCPICRAEIRGTVRTYMP